METEKMDEQFVIEMQGKFDALEMMVSGLLQDANLPIEYYDDDTILSTLQSLVFDIQASEEIKSTRSQSALGSTSAKIASYELEYSQLRQKKQQLLKALQNTQNITINSILKKLQDRKNQILKSALFETSQILLSRSRVNRSQIDAIFTSALAKCVRNSVVSILKDLDVLENSK